METGVINYAVYENRTEYLGVAEVTMPTVQFLTQTIKGAGIAGEVESILTGQMQAMEVGFKWHVLTKQAMALSTPKQHTLELREVQQSMGATGAISVTGVKHILKITPKSMSGGSLKPQSTSDPETKASVQYWAEYRDGKMVMELDPLGYKCLMSGTDYLASVRKAMGK